VAERDKHAECDKVDRGREGREDEALRQSRVRLALSLAVAMMVVPAACTTAGVVGGECRAGFGVCDGDCVDLQNDDLNCGECGHVCPSDMPCAVAVCGGDLPPLHGNAGNGGAGGDRGGDTGGGDRGGAGGAAGGASGGSGASGGGNAGGGVTGGVAGDTGATGGIIGGAGGNTGGVSGDTGGAGGVGQAGGGPGGGGAGGSACVAPFDTPQQCGDCDTRCSGSTPLCAPEGGSFTCVPVCDPPLTNCDGQCVELASDPFNCGACRTRCASGICQSGTCVGAVPGNLVLMCLNYRQTFQNRSQQVLLGNAVFLPTGNPVRVLAYTEYTSDRLVAQVTKTLDWASTDRGRTYEWSTVTDAQVLDSTLSIFDHDVLIVLDQDLAPASDALTTLGSAVAGAIDGFARAGGMVVVLSGVTGEMAGFLTNADLLEVDGQTDVTGTDIYNRSPGNVVGVGVASPFRALQDTCVFETTVTEDGSTFFVVTDTDPASALGIGKPVVVHRIVTDT
jgi:hypothetical protein